MNNSEEIEELCEMASDESLEIDEFENLAAHDSYMVRKTLAENPAIPVTLLLKLSQDSQELVRASVATNSATPTEVLEKLARDPHWKVRLAAEINDHFPSHLEKTEKLNQAKLCLGLENITQKEINEQISLIEKVKNYFIQFPYVSPNSHHNWNPEKIEFEDFANYLDNPIMKLCRAISSNHEDETVLLALLDLAALDTGRYSLFNWREGEWYGYEAISLSLTENQNSSTKILESIADAEGLIDELYSECAEDYATNFINHKNTSAHVLEQLIMKITGDRVEYPAIEAIRHPQMDPDLLSNLCAEEFRGWYEPDFESEVLPEIVKHLQLPREKVIEFLEHENEEIVLLARINLASRQDTSIEELAALAIDEDIDVRSAAFNNPSATEEIRASAALLGINE